MIDESALTNLGLGAGAAAFVWWFLRHTITTAGKRAEKFQDEVRTDIRQLIKDVAVMQHQVETVKHDINGLGNCIRTKMK